MPVPIGMHEDGATRISIAPGAADLLVIPFPAARQCGWNHGSNIRLIDTHPECNGCHHNIELSCHKFFLYPPPPFGVEPGMVAGNSELGCPFLRQIFRLLASRSVHNRWPMFGVAQYLPCERRTLGWQGFHNLDTDVFAAKTMNEMSGLDEAELRGNVFLDQRRRCEIGRT